MKLPITTGNISQNYEIIDAIFALDSHKEGFFFWGSRPRQGI